MSTIHFLLGGILCLQLLLIFSRTYPKWQKSMEELQLSLVNQWILIVGLCAILNALVRVFILWGGGYFYEQWAFYQRAISPQLLLLHAWLYLSIHIVPLLFGFRIIRHSTPRTVIICIFCSYA